MACVQLAACVELAKPPVISYSPESFQHLYKISRWTFNGRIALRNVQESWSANIKWSHQLHEDLLKFSGPFGQGAMLVAIKPDRIQIDHGNGQLESSAEINAFILQKLGFFVPVQSLRYWVTGLADPQYALTLIDAGFEQFGWTVQYQKFISVKGQFLPQKIHIQKGAAKMQLIIDQWAIDV